MKSIRKIFLITTICLTSASSFGEPLPEADIYRIQIDLETLKSQLEDIAVRLDKDSPGVAKFIVKNAFIQAEQSFRDREYVAAIRQLNLVLNRSPQIEAKTYQLAQFLLGRSYEELSAPSRAIKAYLRYIGSFTTQPEDKGVRLIEVVRRTLLLQQDMAQTQKDELSKLLATLVSLSFPKDLHENIILLSGIAAYHAGKYDVAENWLTPLQDIEIAPDLRAEAGFYLSLNYLAQGEELQAEKKLEEIATAKDPNIQLMRDLSALNLGRLYASKKKPKSAWDWYQHVQGPGLALRLATYESTILLMQSGEYSKALELGHTYIGRYPTSAEAYKLNEWIPFLEYQSGQLDMAEGNLQRRDFSLEGLQKSLFDDYSGRDLVDGQDVNVIKRKTDVMALNSKLLDRSQELFRKAANLRAELGESRQEIRNLIYTLGRATDPRLRPEVEATDTQFRRHLSSLFELGSKLVVSESASYKVKITEADRISIERSEKRREKIIALDGGQGHKEWKTWDSLASQQIRLTNLMDRLEAGRLPLQTSIFEGQKSQATPAEQEKARQAADLLKINQYYEEKTSLLVEDLRLSYLEFIKVPSALQKTRKILLLMAQEYLDSEAVLEVYRDRFENPAMKHQQEAYGKAWVLWRGIATKILLAIKKDEDQQARWLTDRMDDIEEVRTIHESLAKKIAALEFRLGNSTALALPAVLDHFKSYIDQQKSRANKWLADLQWQRYIKQTEERLSLKNEFEKQQTIIQENIKDLDVERAMNE